MFTNRHSKRLIAASFILVAFAFAGFHMTTQANGLMKLQAEMECATGKVQFAFTGQADTTYRVVILDWSGMPVGQSEMVKNTGSSSSGWITMARSFDPGQMTAILAQVDKQSEPVMYMNFAGQCAANATGDNATGNGSNSAAGDKTAANSSADLVKIQANPDLTLYIEKTGPKVAIVVSNHGTVYLYGTLSAGSREALLAANVHLDTAIVPASVDVALNNSGIQVTGAAGNNNVNVNAGANGIKATVNAPVANTGVGANVNTNGVQANATTPAGNVQVDANSGGINVNVGGNNVKVGGDTGGLGPLTK